MEHLNRRLEVARAKPLAVIAVRLAARLYLLPSRKVIVGSSSTSSHSKMRKKLKHFTKRLSKNSHPVSLSLETRVQESQGQLSRILPSLAAVNTLYIMDQYAMEHGPPNDTIQQAYTNFAPKLTTLSVQLSSRSALRTCFPQDIPGLPVLQVFRLWVCSQDVLIHSVDATLRGLLQHSHLLQEIEYYTHNKYSSGFESLWYPEEPSRHPQLHIFKWCQYQPWERFPRPVSMHMSSKLQGFINKFGLQLDVLYIEPAPSSGLWSLVDFGKIVELRVDLVTCIRETEFLASFASQSSIQILEISGYCPALMWGDQFYSMLDTMHSLHTLLFPLVPSALTPVTLEKLAECTQNLKKLVLRIQDGEDDFVAGVDRIQAIKDRDSFNPTNPLYAISYPALQSWSLQDFGVLLSGVSLRRQVIRDFRPLLKAVRDLVPSIQKFYGCSASVSSLTWEEVVDDAEWAGKLSWGEMKTPV
ncbi:hypothetical protein DL96DRAFT_1638515 [Flagelloscypha sp. PMI_526]|nr:hypothetical protein DL96DRAFT_1638515 [Flagelloscypha sp. PMI_526]